MMRLDKYLAHALGVSRSEIKVMLKKGRVSVPGAAALKADMKIDENQTVCVDGRQVTLHTGPLWYMMNKCAGVVTARTDARDRTVMDLMGEDARSDLSPVGRLDKDTEGLLLITSDGLKSHELLSPRKHVDKTYLAWVTGTLDEDTVKRFADGLEIGEKQKTLPAELVLLPDNAFDVPDAVRKGVHRQDMTFTRVVIHEGKFHQVKRMFRAVGSEVCYLKRTGMGCITLDESLSPGEYRLLTEEETALLYQTESDKALQGMEDNHEQPQAHNR